METSDYDFKPALKQFVNDSEYAAHVTTEGILTRSPRILNSLSKLSNKDRQYAKEATILRCYIEKPSIIAGKSFAEMNAETRNKGKYQSTFSLSNSSRYNSVSGSADAKSLRHFPLKNERQLSFNLDTYLEGPVKSNSVINVPIMNERRLSNNTEGKYNFSYAEDSIVSARTTSRLPVYTKEYFDSLDLPGHFNTRGVYGQKAAMTSFTMKRSSSDLSLSNIQPRYGTLERHKNRNLRLKFRSREKTGFLLNSRGKVQPHDYYNSFQNRRKQSVRGSLPQSVSNLQQSGGKVQTKYAPKDQKTKDKQHASISVKMGEIFDGVGALKVSDSVTNVKPKQLSVDVCIQTDFDPNDDEFLLF